LLGADRNQPDAEKGAGQQHEYDTGADVGHQQARQTDLPRQRLLEDVLG